MTPIHYYPHDLALALHQRWPAEAAPLPARAVLTQFISVLYRASLLFEEGRPVEAHAVLASQAQLEAQPVTLTDFHLACFAEPRAWNEQKVRRLSPAVQKSSSLLAVEPTTEGPLRLWGLLFSGHAWDQVPNGPRRVALAPRALLVPAIASRVTLGPTF